jgi:gas vesicle protein
MSKTSNLIAGLISGAALGLTLGVLYAPDKGTKTRKKIKKKALESKETIVEKTNEFTDQISSTLTSKKNEFSNELDKMVNDMSYKADDVIVALEKKLAKLKTENNKLKKS